jgi:hypothetical protein
VLVEQRLRDGLLDGSITVAFRRWRRPQVVAGRRYRTRAGMLAVDAVDVIDPAAITAEDAVRAGYGSPAEAVADLRGRPGDPVFRLALRVLDQPDPRDELARDAALTDADVAAIAARLARLDRASPRGPWTAAALDAIATRPAVLAAELAASLGRDTASFKLDVRKLKAMGLTHSLRRGYELSPRGRAFLDRSAPRPEGAAGS